MCNLSHFYRPLVRMKVLYKYIYFCPGYFLCYVKSLQLCPTLCDPIDGSPPGSTVPGILQARILEWVAISFSNAWKKKVKVKLLSRVRLSASPWTAAHQAPLSMDFPGKSTGVRCHCLLQDISYMDQLYSTWETVKSWIFSRFLFEKFRKI